MSYHEPGALLISWMQQGMELRDKWPTAYVNDLPDSAFLYIAPGGTKKNGKTDGAHRYFPVKDANGKPDAAHINNAIARINQANIPDSAKKKAMTEAKAMAAAHPDIGGGKTASYQGSAGSGTGRSHEPAEVITRSFSLELRAEGDGRTLVGRAVPYGETADIGGGHKERFVMGAFGRQISGGQVHTVKLYGSHDERGMALAKVGRTVSLAEQPDGLHGAWRLYDTPAGDTALTLAKEGELSGLSIGFRDISSVRGADGAYERQAAHLDHVALTDSPVYAGAQVMAVRSGHPVTGYRTALLKAHSILGSIDTLG